MCDRGKFPIPFFETVPLQSATYASYLNVTTRAVGNMSGEKGFRPWRFGILCRLCLYAVSRWTVYEYDIYGAVLRIVEQLDARRNGLLVWTSSGVAWRRR